MDNGSGYLKCGFAGDQFPRATIPSIVGRPELKAGGGIEGATALKDIMVGDEATPYRSMLEINHPLATGVVTDWEDFEILWRYTIEKKLGKDPDLSDCCILVTEAA